MEKINSQAWYLVKNGEANEAFELRDFSIDSINTDEVVVETEGFGLNYADIMARRGLYQAAPPLPAVVGYEVVGKVVAAGSAESENLIGSRVIAFCRFGGYAKHVVTTANAVIPVKDEPIGELMALCTQGVTAYYMASYLTPVREGDNVLVHAAAGGVGTILIQLSKHQGANVIAKVGSDEKVKRVLDLGADHAINYRQGPYDIEIKKRLMDEQLDVSFNPAAGSTFKKDFKLMGAGARMIIFGGSEMSSSGPGIFGKLNFLRKMGLVIPAFLMMRSKNILGVNMLEIADHKPQVLRACLESVLKLYQEGVVKPQIGGMYSAADLPKAHSDMEGGQTMGKLVVCWD
ncbi:MAG: quinone oxidoreductase family protein [Crocinitomicaceae bacterium]